ncbi:MAG: flagellar filament capping protein FliD, partial [Oscillospiraceae bacterium]|nr:flagellar filament capping protein FliD [Oscillospiraceae bacterium]
LNVTKDTTLESLMNSINSNADAGVKVSYSKLTNEFKFTASETGANSRIEFSGLAEKMFGSTSSNGTDNFADMYGIGAPAGGSKDMKLKVGGYGNFIVSVDSTDTVDDVADKINAFARSLGYEASHDEKTGELIVTDRASGEKVSLDMTVDGQKVDPPKTKHTYGQDAIMDVEINGKRFENFTRSNNSFDIDGLTVSVKGTFEAKPKEDGGEYEPVTFTTATDTDKIIDAIRSFVEDYNTMATELKSAYSTLPAQQTNGSRYEPLTAEQENGMTESEIASYNEKAKQGILFGDTTLSSFYGKLLNAIQPGGTDGQTLREIGISTAYSDGMTTLSLDEDKLRTALENDPDKVRNAFTKTREGGSSSDGLMQTMQNTLNNYVKTTGEPKGILITHAGSIKAPTSLNNNSLKTKMDNIDSQITRWQDKMASQIDRYTTKFSRLEQLIAQMNSQYSAMSGLMGGTEGY